MIKTIDPFKVLQRKLELVVQTGLSLARDSDLQVIVQAVTDAGLQLCGAQFGAFFYNVVNAEGESYLLHTLSGAHKDRFDRFPKPRITDLFAPTFEGRAIIRSGDITKDTRYGRLAPHHGMPAEHLPVKSYLAVPVKTASNEVLGALLYGHAEADFFEQEAEDLVATVAAQAAKAIENFRLQEQLNKRLEELQQAEAKSKETTKRLEELAAIVRSSDDAILSKDLTGHITSWNEAATRMLGYRQEEMLGESILKLIPEDLHSDEETILRKIRAGERIEHFETVRLKKNGERIEVSLSISPMRDESGQIVGASKIIRDISNRKRMESSLIQAEKIAATGRMAATIAHEINNPLEAVVNLLYLAKDMAKDPEQVEYLTLAESEVARVSHIAKQTLGYYREHTSAVAVSLTDLALEAIRVYEPKCTAGGIVVKRRLESNSRIVLRRGEMMQVISNLIANAIYAMPEGGALEIAVEDVAAPAAGVVLSVEDDGVGISAEQMPRIFEAFYTTRNSIGTGIGLFVAKQFVEGHGGRIDVESSTDEASHGTRMSIFLPLETPYAVG